MQCNTVTHNQSPPNVVTVTCLAALDITLRPPAAAALDSGQLTSGRKPSDSNNKQTAAILISSSHSTLTVTRHSSTLDSSKETFLVTPTL